MPMLLGLLLDSKPVKDRIIHVSKHGAMRAALVFYAFLSAGIAVYALVSNPSHEYDWMFVFMIFYLISLLYKLGLTHLGLIPVPVPTFIQLAVVESERPLSILDIHVLLLDISNVLIFMSLMRSGFQQYDDPLYAYCELLLMSLMAIYMIEASTVFAVKLIASVANLSYKETRFSERDSSMENGRVDPPDCPICKDNFSEDELVKRLKCKHLFHSHCIDEWLDIKKSCPLCKQDGLEGSSIRAILSR